MYKLFQLLSDRDNELCLRGIILAHKDRLYLDKDMELIHYQNVTQREKEIVVDTWWGNGATRCHRGVVIYTLDEK